jgi:hypothetical protein
VNTPYPPCVPAEDYPGEIVEALREVEKVLLVADDKLDYLIRLLQKGNQEVAKVFFAQHTNIKAMGVVAHHTADALEDTFQAIKEEKEAKRA